MPFFASTARHVQMNCMRKPCVRLSSTTGHRTRLALSPLKCPSCLHTALWRSIVNYILQHEAGWSKGLLGERTIKFSDKARAAAKFMRVPADLLTHSQELQAVSSSRQNMDGYQIISFFRNKLVHQDASFQPTGLQLHECWLLIQWQVEVLILRSIGFTGKIIDRRVRAGWRGTTCEIG